MRTELLRAISANNIPDAPEGKTLKERLDSIYSDHEILFDKAYEAALSNVDYYGAAIPKLKQAQVIGFTNTINYLLVFEVRVKETSPEHFLWEVAAYVVVVKGERKLASTRWTSKQRRALRFVSEAILCRGGSGDVWIDNYLGGSIYTKKLVSFDELDLVDKKSTNEEPLMDIITPTTSPDLAENTQEVPE